MLVEEEMDARFDTKHLEMLTDRDKWRCDDGATASFCALLAKKWPWVDVNSLVRDKGIR